MPRGRECHALQKQERDREGITELELPALPLLLQALKQARGPAVGGTCWQHGAGKILKKCCVLMQNLIFLDWYFYEYLSLTFLIFLLSSRMNQDTLDTVCPTICLPGKHKLWGLG